MKFNLKGTIKTQKTMGDDFGYSQLRSRTFTIRIAEDRNGSESEFRATLLHELLHLWLDLTNRTFNVKLSEDEEHAIIYDSEAVIRYFYKVNTEDRRIKK